MGSGLSSNTEKNLNENISKFERGCQQKLTGARREEQGKDFPYSMECVLWRILQKRFSDMP